VFASSRFFNPDLGTPELMMCGPGRMRLADGPGIGIKPRQDLLEKWTLEHASVSEADALAAGETIGGR
jgi:L-alanine-DL-glutamate epimerase-like enolase superfamily enzyme